MSEFNVDVVDWASIKHQDADTLSRLPTNESDTTPFEGNHLFLTVETPDYNDFLVYFIDTTSNG